jgi:ADP-ribosylglycohydrolase
VRRVLTLHETRMTWEDTLTTLSEETVGLGWVHTVPNAAVLTAGLLYGDGDFTRSITLTVRGGLDTDSNGATAGSVAGVLTGGDTIPDQWKDPLEDTVRSAVFGFDGARISELAARTVQLAESADV